MEMVSDTQVRAYRSEDVADTILIVFLMILLLLCNGGHIMESFFSMYLIVLVLLVRSHIINSSSVKDLNILANLTSSCS